MKGVSAQKLLLQLVLGCLVACLDPPQSKDGAVGDPSIQSVSLSVTAAQISGDRTRLTVEWKGQHRDRLLLIAVEGLSEPGEEPPHVLDDTLTFPGLVLVQRVTDPSGRSAVTIRDEQLVELFDDRGFAVKVVLAESLEVLTREDSGVKGGGDVLDHRRLASADIEARWGLVCTPESRAELSVFTDVEPILLDAAAPAYLECSVAITMVDAIVSTSLQIVEPDRERR